MNSPTKVITGRIRMSYTNLFTAKSMGEGEEPKYSLCVLIPKSDRETLSKIHNAVEAGKQTGLTLWGGKLPEGLKLPLKDGDIEHPEAEEYAGHYFVNVFSKVKPGIVNKDRNEITDPSEIYSGCYGRISMNLFPYNQGGNKGIGCGLLNVQKLADGDPLFIRSTPEEDFTEAVDDDILW